MKNRYFFIALVVMFGIVVGLSNGLLLPELDEPIIEQQREELQNDDVENYDEREGAQREEMDDGKEMSDTKELKKPDDTKEDWWDYLRVRDVR